ncbi:MAG: hypothetical protein SGJ20_12365, partial [Planctomycetota bacterium]|nr:hypothetical protein [Planctomycetota bacterium]
MTARSSQPRRRSDSSVSSSSVSSRPRVETSAAARVYTDKPNKKNIVNRLLESTLIGKMSYQEYRTKVRNVYDGPKGALLATCSMLSLHAP